MSCALLGAHRISGCHRRVDSYRILPIASRVQTDLRSAPASAESYIGPYWDKYHVGYVGGSGAASSQGSYVAQGRTMIGNAHDHTDPVAPTRPWAFECPYSRVVTADREQENPNCRAQSNCNSGPTGISRQQCDTMRLWTYAQSALSYDVRVSYTNPNYPWIQAVWMWKNYWHWPKQFSIGRMVFPTHVNDVGKHIIHWIWRGYRDCIDVDVLPRSLPVANTSGERSSSTRTEAYFDCDVPCIRNSCARVSAQVPCMATGHPTRRTGFASITRRFPKALTSLTPTGVPAAAAGNRPTIGRFATSSRPKAP